MEKDVRREPGLGLDGGRTAVREHEGQRGSSAKREHEDLWGDTEAVIGDGTELGPEGSKTSKSALCRRNGLPTRAVVVSC
jgi:hypothetical protein